MVRELNEIVDVKVVGWKHTLSVRTLVYIYIRIKSDGMAAV